MALSVLLVSLAGAVLLMGAGTVHIARRDHLAQVLRQHRLPHAIRRTLAATLGILELCIGATLLAGYLLQPAISPILIAAVYTAFAIYLLRLRLVAPTAPCGCSMDDDPAGPAPIARAVVVATCAWCASVDTVAAQPFLTKLACLGAAAMVAIILHTLVSVVSLRTSR